MKYLATLLMTIILLLPAYAMLPATNGATASGMHVEGPLVAATNATVKYKVTITNTFDIYKCTLLIAGQNLSGASPVNQTEQNNTNGVFEFTVHMPNATQTLVLSFKAYGIINTTHKIKIFERRLYVDVKEAYTIIATVKNTETYTVKNVTVKFYIDGKYVGSETISSIAANATKKVTYEWVPDVGDGEHVLKMVIASTGVVFNNNQQEYSRTIYIGTPPNYDWVEYLGIATLSVLAGWLVFMFLFGKRGKKEAKPKWKKS